ncbi:hypothetical protein IQ07DRAFT_586839 [Pyrenochaeta sp. DS3sAY3a]|nr:hypothetical protein IQ07DRAFT_586839 [Pyrenochaeta sp. DS3sAY3a]
MWKVGSRPSTRIFRSESCEYLLTYTRLLRIRWAATGLASLFLAILAIELTLKWNKVQGIYSVETTGQYVPLIIGISSLISVWWNLLRQEGERRRRLRCDQAFGGAGEEYELQSITSAISHAFAKPDIEFLSSGGALSEALEEANQEIVDEPASSTSPV